MFNLGAGEVLIIFAVLLLIFSPSKLAGFGGWLGEGVKNLHRADRGASLNRLAPKPAGPKSDVSESAEVNVSAAAK